jgi:alkylhydroperoxidase family enzyme
MKKVLEEHKAARPRLPLPALTAEEKARPGARPVVNNGRMRQLYLPADLRGGDFVREPDPAMTLSSTFKTELFWIVARSNDCRYCLGHQEWKLAGAGLSEEQVASLDCDWGRWTPAEQAAFEAARRLTYEPHRLGSDFLQPLRRHYTDVQILEILMTVANNNATTRWTGGLNIPQDGDGAFFSAKGGGRDRLSGFLTPTASEYRDRRSKVCPAWKDEPRPPLEPMDRVEAALAAARQRKPQLALAGEEAARALVPADWPAGPLPQWVRLLAQFPKAGKARIASLHAARDKGTLDPQLRAEVAWIAARNDRAWYALGHAQRRLQQAGLSRRQREVLDGSWDQCTAAENAAFSLTRKLIATPGLVSDDDFTQLRRHYSDKQVAELVYHITLAAFFNRITEAAGLRLES